MMQSAMTAILRDASGKMHHGILFARRLLVTIIECYESKEGSSEENVL